MENMTIREIDYIRLAIDSQIQALRQDEEQFECLTVANSERLTELTAIAEKLGPYLGGLRKRR